MLTISVLGPVEVRRDGQVVAVPGGKSSELLVRLAMEAGVVVRTDRLVEDLWALDAVRTSRNTLQSKVLRLRRALGEPPAIVSGDGGYALAVDPADVDALAVLDDATRAAALLNAGDHRGAIAVCEVALARFRGEILPGAEDGDWATAHRTRLDEARLRLLETRFAALAATGAAGELVGELESAVAEHPFQEGLWAQLVTALYRSGRQAEALATYQRIRQRLADELGLDPGPQLRDLERRILVHDGSLVHDVGVGVGVDGSPLAATATGNLPSMATELIGRDAELATLAELLATRRLVEIIGPGGVGKTALAVAAARCVIRPGGVWLARLEAARTRFDVLDTVVAALGTSGAVGGEAALADRMRATQALLVLDNCEHVVGAAAELAVRLLDAAPGITILCTSQVPLGVDGEARFELAPLALHDAAELFTRRAVVPRAGAATDGDDDGRAAVDELCRSLDGLPLAIELAAARTRTLSVQEIIRRLDDRFGVLSDPTSRRPERRRALRATIGWSYELLFPDDQRGLWALATFTGGAPLAAVEFVLNALDVPATAAIDVIGRLEGRSLVTVDDASAYPRYGLLDSIRAFAVEAMADAGSTDVALEAHSRWFADTAGRSTAAVRSDHQAEHLAFARTERPNIDAAISWCLVQDPARALRIVDGYGWAWVVLGDIRAAGRIAATLAAAGPDAPGARAEALLLLAWLEPSTGDLGRARRQIAEAEALAVSIGDVDLQARSRYYAAYVASHEADFARAMELTDESRQLYGTRDRPWDIAANWLLTARAAIAAGDRRRSVEACEEIERRLSTIDDPWLHVRRDAALGELARTELRFADAARYGSRAAETSGRLGFLAMEAYHLANLGRAQWLAGDEAAGRVTLELAIAKAEANGDVRLAALVRVHLGRVLRVLGELDRARATLDSASAWHVAAGGGEQALLGDVVRAALDASDAVAGAAARLEGILAAARAVDDAPVEVLALDALAVVAARAGDPDRARALISTSDGRMPAAAHTISARDRTDRAAADDLWARRARHQ